MTEHIELNYGDKVHQGFFTPIQQLLGSAAPSLRIAVLNSTTLTIVADDTDKQSGVAIDGKYRWVGSADMPLTAALPGGLTDGVGSVWVTAVDNNFTGPPEEPDQGQDYSFGLEIRASGEPTAALKRQVGEVDVKSSAIVALRQWGGGRANGEFALAAKPDTVNTAALHLKALPSQVASVIRVDDDSNVPISYLTPAGNLFLKNTLILFNGADNADKVVKLDASGVASAALITNTNISASAAIGHSKLADITAGRVLMGNASNVPTATAISGDITITSSGVVTIGNDAVNAAKIAASAVGTSELADDAVTAAKIATDAVGTAEIAANAVNTSEIADDAVTAAKIATDAVGTTEIAADAVTASEIAADAVGASELANDAVADANVAAGAAISHAKLASITAGRVLLGNGSNVPTATALSGDVTVNSSGVTTIQPNAVGPTEIADDAVTSPKLNLSVMTAKNASSVNISGGSPVEICRTANMVVGGIYLVLASVTFYVNSASAVTFILNAGLENMETLLHTPGSGEYQSKSSCGIWTAGYEVPFALFLQTSSGSGHNCPAGYGSIVALRIG